MEDLQTELFFCAEVFYIEPNEENGKEITLPFLYVFMFFDHRFSVYKCFYGTFSEEEICLINANIF